MRNSIDTTTKADALSIHTIVMSSPFSMLGMLSKARRAASKRISSTDDNSDSRSIASVSKEDKKAKKQSSKILRALEKSKEGTFSSQPRILN